MRAMTLKPEPKISGLYTIKSCYQDQTAGLNPEYHSQTLLDNLGGSSSRFFLSLPHVQC